MTILPALKMVMTKRTHLAIVLLAIVFVLYSGNPLLFELNFFLNELLSLCGFILFINSGGALYRKGDLLRNFVCLYLLYCLLYAVFFAFVATDYYAFFRHTVVIYSAFVFFLGRAIYPYLVIQRHRWVEWLCLIPFHLIAYLPLTILTLGKWFGHKKHWYWIVVPWFMLTYLVIGQATVIAVAASVVLIMTLKIPKLVLAVVIAMFGGFLILGWDTLSEVYTFFISNDIFDAMESYSVLALEGNTTVRLLMWLHVLLEVIPQNPLGIGLGTKLFDENIIVKLHLIGALMKDEYAEYNLSTHNSFVYLTARFGVPMLILFSVFYYKLIVNFRKNLSRDVVSVQETITFLAFIAVSVMASLNVVIESPLHSGLYWGLLGMYSAALESRGRLNVKPNVNNI